MVIFLKNGALKYLFKNMLYKIINTGRGAGGGGGGTGGQPQC